MSLKKSVLLLFFILLFVNQSFAFDMKVSLTSPENMNLNGQVAYYNLRESSGVEINGSSIVEGSSMLIENVVEGNYSLSVDLDDLQTESYDYFGTFNGFVEENKIINLFVLPIGSISVSVVDANNKPIKRALLRIDCSKSYGSNGYFRTDEFGVVNVPRLPEASCLIRCAVDDYVKNRDINVTKGLHQKVDFEFDEIKSDFNYLFSVIVVVLVVGFFGFIFFSKRSYRKNIKKDVVKNNSASKEDLLITLNESERKVVEFLLHEKESSSNKNNFFVNQANIIHGAGIPKTTLVRLLSSLEKKKILEVEKFGKSKRVRFTAWFDKK
ncbi:hypothetical protein COV13_03720 [Candidatus Woesearchaeota archaeon CG10_big_fil_rev_8_21_14_0_10_32_9]|nr:MAG: hypothetical protein COV13_03720 [Candidatus Woesearchaeota archaeon CG10_big_fil_rev_8_21_14_0_10_32_9]